MAHEQSTPTTRFRVCYYCDTPIPASQAHAATRHILGIGVVCVCRRCDLDDARRGRQ